MANPNPSPETRFKPGTVGNPGGKTKEQRQAEIDAAEKAAILRDKMLSLMMEKVEGGEIDLLELIDPATLKLFKDSEDRAHGTPTAHTDLTNSDGSLKTLDPSKLTMEQRKALLAAQITDEPDPNAG